MSNSVVTIPDLENWPTIPELAARTGMSARSIYREIEDGKIRTAQRPVPKRKPLTVLNPVDAEAWVASVMTPKPRIVPSQELVTVTHGAVAKPVTVTGKNVSISDGKMDIQWPISELRWKVYLETEEAVRYSGLTAECLSELAESSKIKRLTNMRPYRYRRADLDAL